jgi:hypothetical protein
MINKNELCDQIRTIYPDIGICGIDIDVDYDNKEQRWTVVLRKDKTELKTFLEPGDAEFCLMGKKCVGLAIEINQLKDSIERMPGRVSSQKGKGASEAVSCEKAPEFAEHYRLVDDDLPCDDGRAGRA